MIRYITSSDGQNQYQVTKVFTDYDGTRHDFSVLEVNNTDRSIATSSLANSDIYHQTLTNESPSLLTTGYGIDIGVDKGTGGTNKNYYYQLQKGNVHPTTDNNALKTVNNGSIWLSQKSNNRVNLGDAASMYLPDQMFATCSAQPTDHGDSGGPVFLERDGKYEIIGDTSWGLTISYGSSYLSYNQCMNHSGNNLPNTKISVFTDLTYQSNNYQLLQSYLQQIAS